MDFQIGEKVRFLHGTEEGVVHRLLPGREVEVLVDDFLEMVVSANELVRIDAREKMLESGSTPSQKVAPRPSRVIKPAELVVVEALDFYEIWLLNPTSDELLFTVHLKVRNKFQALNSGRVGTEDQQFLYKLPSNELHDSKSLHINWLTYQRGEGAQPVPPASLEIPIRQHVLKKQPHEIPELKKEGYVFPLRKQGKVEEEQQEAEKPKPQKNTEGFSDPGEVVDLHIEKLVDRVFGLTSDTMLQIQLEAFEKALQAGILHGRPGMVFIHGIGTGKLKREIHNRLKENQFVRDWKLADPMVFGNGATEVSFK